MGRYRLARIAIPFALALAAPLSTLGCSRQDASNDREINEKKQQVKEETLKSVAASMTKGKSPLGEHYIVDMHGQTITDQHLSALADARRVTTLNLSRSTVTDQQLAQLRDMGGTKLFNKVDLSHTAATDATVEWLADAPLLGELNVAGTKVTPAAIANLKKKRKDNPSIDFRLKNVNVITK